MEKISIITVSYNSASTIRETIESVLSQTYPNIEYIILDGGSTDGTQEIIKESESRISKFICEKDNGLYDAMNKGIRMATGSIIGILNSDDLYHDADTLSQVMASFEKTNSDCVFGDLFYFKSKNPKKALRYYRGSNFSPQRIRWGLLPPHPAFFVRACIYHRIGLFDTQFKLAADFDLMARFLYVHRISYHYIPRLLVKMRIGGLSTESFRHILKMNREDIASCKKNNIDTNFLLFHIKYLFKIVGVVNPRYFF